MWRQSVQPAPFRIWKKGTAKVGLKEPLDVGKRVRKKRWSIHPSVLYAQVRSIPLVPLFISSEAVSLYSAFCARLATNSQPSTRLELHTKRTFIFQPKPWRAQWLYGCWKREWVTQNFPCSGERKAREKKEVGSHILLTLSYHGNASSSLEKFWAILHAKGLTTHFLPECKCSIVDMTDWKCELCWFWQAFSWLSHLTLSLHFTFWGLFWYSNWPSNERNR